MRANARTRRANASRSKECATGRTSPRSRMSSPLVGIVVGSESDRERMRPALDELETRGIPHEFEVRSAHRQPDAVAEYARTAGDRGLKVLIAGAGLAAALPGVVAAHTDLPVIGVPLRSSMSLLDGLDALLSIVQMPPGVPVACVGVDNAKNAAVLAARILGPTACPLSRIAPVIPRYSRPAMAAIWSDESRFRRWLDVELAALDAWAEVGVVPADDVAAIRAVVQVPTHERVAEIERITDHDTAAFVDAVAEQVGQQGRWVHFGLTSSDVVDTALSLQIQDAGRLIVGGIEHAFGAVVARAEEHRHTVCIGRSHGVHAEPTTFGWKLAGWAFELDRGRRRLGQALETNRVGQLSGTVGTYAQVDPDVERIACERLGLEPDPLSTQVIARDRHAELLCALALAATSVERFATEIRHLARTEVREVEEPFGRGMKGSSAMPHKRNPKVAERLCGLARVVRAAALVGFEDVPLWHERDISQSSAERVVIPDAFLALDYMLDRFGWIMGGLVVYPERMRRNLDASHGLFFSHRLLLALVESGLGRDEAYRAVQRHAMQAWEEERDFRGLVAADSEFAGRLPPDALEAVFDLKASVRHVDVVFERLHALVQKEEAVHA